MLARRHRADTRDFDQAMEIGFFTLCTACHYTAVFFFAHFLCRTACCLFTIHAGKLCRLRIYVGHAQSARRGNFGTVLQ